MDAIRLQRKPALHGKVLLSSRSVRTGLAYDLGRADVCRARRLGRGCGLTLPRRDCTAEGHSPEYFQRIWPSQWSTDTQGWSVQPSSQLRSYASAEPFQVCAPQTASPGCAPAGLLLMVLCASLGRRPSEQCGSRSECGVGKFVRVSCKLLLGRLPSFMRMVQMYTTSSSQKACVVLHC